MVAKWNGPDKVVGILNLLILIVFPFCAVNGYFVYFQSALEMPIFSQDTKTDHRFVHTALAQPEIKM